MKLEYESRTNAANGRFRNFDRIGVACTGFFSVGRLSRYCSVQAASLGGTGYAAPAGSHCSGDDLDRVEFAGAMWSGTVGG